MAFETADLIESVRKARKSFLKHIDGITDEQVVWKPYPECKSIAETLDHLHWGDNATVQNAKSGQDPDYSSVPSAPPTQSLAELKSRLAESHSALMKYLTSEFAGKPLDTPISFYGHPTPIGDALGALLSEEGYHTGQISFVRMATDPSWDYYTAIYE
jgi:uncharacterized damage-inducible protein DinB